MFSLLDALLFKPLPVRSPERLIRIGALENNGRTIALPGPLLDDLRREPLLEGVCGFQTPLSTVEIKSTPEPLGALSVTGDCYQTLGVRAVIGRTFTPADDLPNGARVAMLGYGFWQQRFGGNPNVLGQVIRIEGVPFTIIGITEQRFHGLLVGVAAGSSAFGVLPAWQTSDIDPAATLKAASRGLSSARATNRRILICGQVALTLVLVTGAAVFIETLNHLENESLGFQATDAAA
jgi:hypothetical protein